MWKSAHCFGTLESTIKMRLFSEDGVIGMQAHEIIAGVFDNFCEAVKKEDGDSFAALTVADVLPQTDLFLANSQKVNQERSSLRINRIEQEGDVAEVFFDLIGKSGESLDEGMLTMTLEADTWRIRSL
jgi:hypothetical protein